MHHGLIVHEAEPRGGKAVELHHRDRLCHATPRVLECLRGKRAHAAFHKTALVRCINTEPEHTGNAEVALDPLLKTPVPHELSPTTEGSVATFVRTKTA